MNFLSKKTCLNMTQFPLTYVALVLLILCPYKTTFAAASADNTSPAHLELPKPTEGMFKLPYGVRVANFGCSLKTFVREKALPNKRNEMTLQLYGNLDFDFKNFDSVRFYIGKKTITSEPHPPIASYTLLYTNEQTPPRLLEYSFNGEKVLHYKPLNPSAPAYNVGSTEYTQDTLFHAQNGGYYATTEQSLPCYYGYQFHQAPYGAAAYGYVPQPPLPALIASLSPEEISSKEVSKEEAILITHCGTTEQKLALTQKELKVALLGLAAQSHQPVITHPVQTKLHPVLNTTAFPALSQETKKVAIAKLTPPIAQPSEPTWQPARPVRSTPIARPTPPPPSAIRATPHSQAIAKPVERRLPDCNTGDRERYRAIKTELDKKNRDYRLCIHFLQECDPQTSGYLPHVTMCVNSLNKLNFFPELPDDELLAFDQLVSQAQKTAKEGYQVPLTTYLSKRERQRNKKRLEEERTQREAEEKRKREEEQKKQEAEAQEIARIKSKENSERMKAAREKREEELFQKQEALAAKSGKAHKEIPAGSAVTVRPDRAPDFRNEKKLIARVQKAAALSTAIQEEEDLYSSLTTLLTQNNYTQALLALSRCEKSSRRFANLFLAHLSTIEEKGTEQDKTCCKALALELLTVSLVKKHLTKEEKIKLYRYVSQQTQDKKEQEHYYEELKTLGDPFSIAHLQACEYLNFEKTDDAKWEQHQKKVVEFLTKHSRFLMKEIVDTLQKKYGIIQEETSHLTKVMFNPLPDGYKIQCLEHRGHEILVAYDENQSLCLEETLNLALQNFPSINEKTFNASLIICNGYIEEIFKSKKSPEEVAAAARKLIHHFIDSLNGRENLLINAIESIFKTYKGGFILFCQTALAAFSPQNKYALAQKVAPLIPPFLEKLESSEFLEQCPGFVKHMLKLQKTIDETLAEGDPAEEQTAFLKSKLQKVLRAKRTKPTTATAVDTDTVKDLLKSSITASRALVKETLETSKEYFASLKAATHSDELKNLVEQMDTPTEHLERESIVMEQL